MHKICQCGKIWLLSIYYHITFRPCFALCLSLSACPPFCKYMLHFYAVHSIIDYIKMLNPVKCSIITEAGTIGHDAFAACMDITI